MQKRLFFISMDPWLPDEKGGAQLSTYTLLQELQQRGWKIFIMCRELRAISGAYYSIDFTTGFTCLRYKEDITPDAMLSLFREQIKEFNATHVLGEFFSRDIDVCFTLLSSASQRRIKTFCFVRKIENFRALKSTLEIPNETQLIANSEFTAEEIFKSFNKNVEIITPFINFDSVKVSTFNPLYITFINPIKVKGVETAIAIAKKMKQHKFLFVIGGWHEKNYIQTNPIMREIEGIPNISMIPYQEDMRSVYSVSKILLAPSLFEETFGRVILEAQSNSIPVVGSNRGNIQKTIGNGGFAIDDYQNADEYVHKINFLLSDPVVYKRYAHAALMQSNKIEFSLESQIKKFSMLLEQGV